MNQTQTTDESQALTNSSQIDVLPMNDELYVEKSDIFGCSTEKALRLEDELRKEDCEFEAVVAAIDRVTDVQGSIDKIIVRACTDIRRKKSYIDWILRLADTHIRKLKAGLKPGKKTVKLGTAGVVQFVKQGGFYVDDKEKLLCALEKMSDEELATFGAKRAVSYRTAEVLKCVADTGEAIPGVEYIPPDEYATFKVGANKPWSTRNLKILVGRALEGQSLGGEDDADI